MNLRPGRRPIVIQEKKQKLTFICDSNSSQNCFGRIMLYLVVAMEYISFDSSRIQNNDWRSSALEWGAIDPCGTENGDPTVIEGIFYLSL